MSDEKKPQPVRRYDASEVMYTLDGVDPKPSVSGNWVRYPDHEATIEALRAERDEAIRHSEDADKAWSSAVDAECAAINRAEAAEAALARAREALGPFAKMAEELENEPAWAGVLEHDHPLAGRVTVEDFRRARTILAETEGRG